VTVHEIPASSMLRIAPGGWEDGGGDALVALLQEGNKGALWTLVEVHRAELEPPTVTKCCPLATTLGTRVIPRPFDGRCLQCL
jgi:hypothetical protein